MLMEQMQAFATHQLDQVIALADIQELVPPARYHLSVGPSYPPIFLCDAA